MSGLSNRDKRTKSASKKRNGTGRHGEIDVPDTEAPTDGMSKFSIDYMQLNDIGGERAKSSPVMANHEDGGVFVYATPGKGIQGDKYWVPKRIAKDIDNCGTQAAKVQIKSDPGLAIVAVREEI